MLLSLKKIIKGLYLILQEIIPSFSTQNIADCKFEDVKRDVCNNTIQPDNSSPSPASTLDSCKTPICIDCYEGRHLIIEELVTTLLDRINYYLINT